VTRARQTGAIRAIVAVASLAALASATTAAPQLDQPSVIRHIDAAVHDRYEQVAAFTDVERYAVFRGKDQTHPAAQMTVKSTYRKGVGKTYTILAASGSAIIRKLGLIPLLENEQRINVPSRVEASWFTSSNYDMKLKPGGIQQLHGRGCVAVAITPRQKATNMIDGTLWVHADDYQIAQIDGIASKSPSVWAGTTHMMRQYENINGFAMATHARAESDSFLFGRTVVTIDYTDYQLQVLPPR
jgi:hypothetical protein